MTDIYKGRNITDRDKIDYAIERVLVELTNKEPKQFVVGSDYVDGCIVHVADLYSQPCKHVEQDGKKYLSCSEDSICIFAAENYATLIKECYPMMRPNGWGDEEDVIPGTPTYTLATCRDMDGIYDLVY
jgi:hypothetical protein